MVVVMTGETPWTNIVGGSSRVSTCTGKKSVKVFSQIIRSITHVDMFKIGEHKTLFNSNSQNAHHCLQAQYCIRRGEYLLTIPQVFVNIAGARL